MSFEWCTLDAPLSDFVVGLYVRLEVHPVASNFGNILTMRLLYDTKL